jgi:cell division initiation protein
MPDQSSAATEHAIIQEITGPLETLPDDPVALVHAEFPTAMRGYDRAAVDDYMQQMAHLVAELQATRSPEAAVRRALERVGEQISGILQRAHETAEQITAQSRREAEDRLEQARTEAAQIAGAAEQRVKDLDGDTDRIWLERQRIVSDAEDLAGQLVALAKSAVDRFPPDEESDDAADQTAPYDDDSVPTVAGAPTFLEDTAPDDDEAEPAAADEVAQSAQGEAAPSPYDEEAPADPEDRAEGTEATRFVDAGDEEEDFFDDEEPEPTFDDIEKTVAFRPLTPGEPDGGTTQAADDEPAEPTDQASSAPEGERPEAGRPADGESTAIIPPASQAANRRRRRS